MAIVKSWHRRAQLMMTERLAKPGVYLRLAMGVVALAVVSVVSSVVVVAPAWANQTDPANPTNQTNQTNPTNQAIEQFEQFVQTVPAARGTFEQFTVGPDGQTSRAQAGTFAFARPGKFRWDIQTPYPQQVASDGSTLYQHDPDLQQLTVRSLDQSIGSSPAAILFGQGKLQESFDVTALPDDAGMAWLRAVPKRPDAGLTRLDVGMREGRPTRLLLVDGFGQTTQVELLTLRAQSQFGANEFVIEPPAGTDIIRMQ